MKGLSQAATVLSFIIYPIVLALRWLLILLYWLISPFIYMGRLTKEILMLPLRAVGHFFVHFEVGNVVLDRVRSTANTLQRHSSTSSPSPLPSVFCLVWSYTPPYALPPRSSASIGPQYRAPRLRKVTTPLPIAPPGRRRERHSSTKKREVLCGQSC